jgi:hypothetical protein
MKIKLTDLLNEGNKDTYFQTFSAASDFARDSAEKRGYVIDEDDWQTQVAFGGKYTRARPSIGKSHSFIIGLSKNGKPQRKSLSFQVFGMPSGNYELTHYIA